VDVDVDFAASCGPLASSRLGGDPRGRVGGIRQELAAGLTRSPLEPAETPPIFKQWQICLTRC
jgi:hypothetical protein